MSGFDGQRLASGHQDRVVKLLLERCLGELREKRPPVVLDFSTAGYVPMETQPEVRAWLESSYRLVSTQEISWWLHPKGHIRVYLRGDLDGRGGSG